MAVRKVIQPNDGVHLICTECFLEKENSEFYRLKVGHKNFSTYGGYCLPCKECRRKRCRSRGVNGKTEGDREREKSYRSTEEYKSKRRELSRNRYRMMSEFRELVAVRKSRRRAREKSVGSSLTNLDWSNVLRAYGESCVYCQTTGRMSIEHLVPLSSGGMNSIDNVMPACMACNQRKNAMNVEDFLYKNKVDRVKFIARRGVGLFRLMTM